MLVSTCLLAQSVLQTNETVPLRNERSIKPQAIYNQLIDPSNQVYYSLILNILFGSYLVYTNVIEQGCRLPDGSKVPNGWENLYNNCQEKCVCRRNKFRCSANSCDLNYNECNVNFYGEEYCQGALLVLYSGDNINDDFSRLINLDGLILFLNKFIHNYRNI